MDDERDDETGDDEGRSALARRNEQERRELAKLLRRIELSTRNLDRFGVPMPLSESTERRHVTPKRDRPKCGAKTRKGGKCQAPAVWDREHDRPRNGRCRIHGGLSTGARTPEGRERVRQAAVRQARLRAARQAAQRPRTAKPKA